MDIVGTIRIDASSSFEETVRLTEKALGVQFRRDTSGRFEEFPAFVTCVLGVDIAILGIPDKDDQCGEEIDEYSIVIQTLEDGLDSEPETDISEHISWLLRAVGLKATSTSM